MGSPPQHPLHTSQASAGQDLFALFDWLTSSLPLRRNARSFPVIVLEPARDDPGDPERFLEALRRGANELNLPSLSPPLGAGGTGVDGVAEGIALVDHLSQRLTWSRAASIYGRYRFPRSDLVRSIQAAAAEPGPDGSPPLPPARRSPAAAVKAWNDNAGLFPWQGRPFKAPAWWSTLGASVVAVIAVLAGGIAEQTPRRLLITAAVLLAGLLLLLAALTARRIWLPVLSRLGFGSRYRWLANSSFFAVLGDGDDDGGEVGFEGRLHRVFERLGKPGAMRFLLQVKTFALLEDLRDNHNKLTPSLRGFKRPAPPVVFLSDIREANGGLEVISAMSDIRSRRSEFHPLLTVASIGADQRDILSGLTLEPEEGLPAQERYEQWRSSLSTSQAPSQAVLLPWLLRVPIQNAEQPPEPPANLMPRRRPRWTWLWSRRGLIVAVLLCGIAATYAQVQLRSTYCHVGVPFSWNADSRLQTNPDGSHECVGVSTHGVRFERSSDSLGLDGKRRPISTGNRGAQLTLADLEAKIEAENRRVESGPDPYVTLVYAGIFTAGSGQSDLTVSSIRELAGAYLAQIRNNQSSKAGTIGNRMKVRLLPANTGQDMAFSEHTVDRILHLARHDPTMVGVVGMGRNTQRSQAAIRRLVQAGLPVLATVNSSDENPGLPHYYGVAAIDREEALASKAAVRAELGGRRIGHMMIVHREPGPSGDIYSGEIARDVEQTLAPRATTTVRYVDGNDVASKVRAACQNDNGSPYSLIYYAGRAEDLRGLMYGLTQGGCTTRKLVLISGDDITKAPLGSGEGQVPLDPHITVYYTAFVHLPTLIAGNADQSDGFFLLARNELGIGVPRVSPTEPLLVDGQMELTYDATTALAQSAQNALDDLGLNRDKGDSPQVTGSASVSSGMVLLELRRLYARKGATGDLDFRKDSHQPGALTNRGLTLIKVTMRDGQVVSEPVCGRLNGGRPFPRLSPCPQ